jgi:hypothetical protein
MADAPIHPSRAESTRSIWRFLILALLAAFAIAAATVVFIIWHVTGPAATVSISNQFSEYLPTAGPSDGILETATCSVPETFTLTESGSLFNVIPLGTTVSEIRVPAIYRYHIRLFDPWKLEAKGPICIVTAPNFEPSLPPAIITGQMEKSTSAGWLSFDAQANLDTLEQGITDELTRRAYDKTHRDYVREACRQSVAEFVKAWLMKEDDWRSDRFHRVVVIFPDDPTPLGTAALPLTIENQGEH